MKFTSAVVLSLAGFAIAKGNNKAANSTSTKSQCREVEKLTFVTQIAANTTELDKITKGNATKAAEFQAKASDAATKLNTLQGNATLMTACNAIFAQDQMSAACGEMAAIEEGQKIVANQTLLDKITKNNATKADAFKAKVAAKAQTLTSLQSNNTLTAYCSTLDDKFACKSMAKLAKEQALSKNTTALDAKFKGDATKISNFQAKVSEKATKLDAMMNNATLMATCKSLNITTAATATGDKAKSAGVSVQALAGGQVLALVSVFAYALTVL